MALLSPILHAHLQILRIFTNTPSAHMSLSWQEWVLGIHRGIKVEGVPSGLSLAEVQAPR